MNNNLADLYDTHMGSKPFDRLAQTRRHAIAYMSLLYPPIYIRI